MWFAYKSAALDCLTFFAASVIYFCLQEKLRKRIQSAGRWEMAEIR